MHLVLVESPTKCKTLKKFLGKDYKVLASGGHIRDLPKSKLGIDTENDFEPKYVIPSRARKKLKELREEAGKAESIILSTDPDREGEAISYHLLEALNIKDYKRITFHEITKAAVEEAQKSPRQIDMNLVNAQQARRVLDRLVGYNLSPLLWKKVARGLSAGRVQSAALRMIVEREEEIERFNSQEYWSINALLSATKGKFTAELREKNGEALKKYAIKTKEEAEEMKEDLQNADFRVERVEKKEKKRHPLPPFTTSTMQQDAFRRMRFSSRFTMRVAQGLYEKGLISYHRTDSLHLSAEAKETAKRAINQNYGENYHKERSFASKGRTQEAHEAIRPANPELIAENAKNLKKEEKKLYDLIWRRFIASQMKEALFDSTKVEVIAEAENSYKLAVSGAILRFDGFTRAYKIKFEETELPQVEEKEELEAEEIQTQQHFTKPPARFTEAGLIKEMEKHGIGRPSTYAPTIFTLSQRNYTEKIEKRQLKPTDIGRVVNKLLLNHFPSIVSLKFTSEMEEDLDQIAAGQKEWKEIIREFYGDFAKKIEEKEKEIKKSDLMEEKTEEKCEKCGSEMVIKLGRYGKFLACKNFPECKNTKNISDEGGEQKDCDLCGAKMQIKQSKYGKFYGCEKYPECKNIKPVENRLNIPCPQCKEGEVVQKKSKKGKFFYACNRYPDCDFTSSYKPKEEEQTKEETE